MTQSKFYVYISDGCRKDASSHSMINVVEGIQQSVERNQSTSGFEPFPANFIKKRFRNFRLIAYKATIGNDTLIVFLHVFKRGSQEYNNFLQTLKTNPDNLTKLLPYEQNRLNQLYEERRNSPAIQLPTLMIEHYAWLLQNNQINDDGYNVVLETDKWVQKMRSDNMNDYRNLYLGELVNLLERKSEITPGVCHISWNNPMSIGIVYVYLPNEMSWVLLDALRSADRQDLDTIRNRFKDELGDHLDIASMKRRINIHRAYPEYILLERDYWLAIQRDTVANISLSQEESELLVSLQSRQIDFPLFINGRAGSGKSTMLQYLVTDYLDYSLRNNTELKPIYITSSQDLIRRARDTVQKFLTLHHGKIAEAQIPNENINEMLDSSFVVFHEYLLSMLPPDKKQHYDSTRYVAFTDFSKLWSETYGKSQNASRISPELAWHTIRSYIKGIQSEHGDALGPEEFKALPNKQKSVSQDTFEFVFKFAWPWYKDICTIHGYWDDQDLAACVLETDVAKDQKRGAVFCDEAQDFTPIELEIIFQLSVFSQLQMTEQDLKRVPILFAGDPLQTINPTGFRWEAVKADFHERFTATLGTYNNSSNIEITYRELQFNYRSRHNIVRFCNLIQMVRTVLFRGQRVEPQRPWWNDLSNDPVYYVTDTSITGRHILENQDIFKLVNCEHDKESEYAAQDDVLNQLDQNQGVYRNVLGPIRAKGLEFSRVVLYKFAANTPFDLEDIIRRISQGSDITQESLLPAVYFFNRLYVAASRAKEQLIIVDSQDAFTRFWNFIIDPHSTDKIMNQTGNGDLWRNSIANPMTLTDGRIWRGLSINILGQAEMYERDGDLNRDPYLLRQAAIAFSNVINRKPDALRCEAKALECEDKFTDAGDKYMEIPDLDKAYNCYWKAKNYGRIITFVKTNKNYAMRMDTIASQFMVSASSTTARDLIDGCLAQVDVPGWLAKVAGDTTWHHVINDLAQWLVRNKSYDSINDWVRIYHFFEKLSAAGLEIKLQSRALFAYYGNLYQEAARKWEMSGETNSREYFTAKAYSIHFPENVPWYAHLNNYDAIYDAWNRSPLSHSDLILLDNRVFIGIVDTALHVNNLELGVSLLRSRPDLIRVKKLINLAMTQNTWQQVRDGICIGITLFVTKGEWSQVVGIISNYTLAGLIDDDEAIASNIMRTEEWFSLSVRQHAIKVLAESANIPTDSRDTPLSTYLITTFTKGDIIEAYRSHNDVSPKYVGAAIERVCRRTEALIFYEALERTTPSPQLKRFARERQVRCHEWLADYYRERNEMRESLTRQSRADVIRQRNNLGDEQFTEYPILP